MQYKVAFLKMQGSLHYEKHLLFSWTGKLSSAFTTQHVLCCSLGHDDDITSSPCVPSLSQNDSHVSMCLSSFVDNPHSFSCLSLSLKALTQTIQHLQTPAEDTASVRIRRPRFWTQIGSSLGKDKDWCWIRFHC